MSEQRKFKHTPGPWIVIAREFSDTALVFDPTGGVIHREALEATGEIGANARLIAAAPELLEGVKEFLLVAETGLDPYCYVDYLRELIARAEGGDDE